MSAAADHNLLPPDVALRHVAILERLHAQGRVSVDELATHFGVTPQTIRKDLKDLAAQRKLTRVHGGAVAASGTANMEYEARRRIAADEKAAIGALAATLIPSEASLFINIGTTTEAVSKALLNHDQLMVVTNNINVANHMREFPKFEVVVSGGVVRASDGGIVGEAAVDFIRQFRVDFAVIGASAIDEDGVLLDFDFREVKVAQAIIENARSTILVADKTKFSRRAPIRIAHMSEITTFVTDQCSQRIRQVCARDGVQLVETDPRV